MHEFTKNEKFVKVDLLRHFDEIEVDTRRNCVVVEAGVTYNRLVEELFKAKKAIESVPSWSNILVIEAILGGCHGGGPKIKSSANYVTKIEFVDHQG